MAYHMTDPNVFYNKEDLWDTGREVYYQNDQEVEPYYTIMKLPDGEKEEYVLMLPFTPSKRANMSAWMCARNDGGKYGQVLVYTFPKKKLIFGPMQIEARINQEQTISKDLTLWNQQGSQVLRGQMLVLPVANTFVYVQPIYIQAAEARMPQLKKVAMAVGNSLIYTDTYEQGLADLARLMQGAAPEAAKPEAVAAAPAAEAPAAAAAGALERRLETIRLHLRRYRELASQGKWAEAGKELEAVETEVQRR